MITVKEFYNQWEETEEKLINMTASPSLASAKLAEEHLKELYEMKETLDKIKPDPNTQIRGINTDVFGRVTFEQIQESANNYHDISSEKYMIINRGAVMSQEREEDLEFFVKKGYLPDNKKA